MNVVAERIERAEPIVQTVEKQRAFVESDPQTWADIDYQRLLAEFESLFNTPPGTPEEARYDALADLIEAYEQQRFQIAKWLHGNETAAAGVAHSNGIVGQAP